MDIYTVPQDRRYWVVRAENGRYYDHFKQYGIIALGHLDELKLPETINGPFFPDEKTLHDKLKDFHDGEGHTSRHMSSHFNQVKSFIYEMNIGDWVITTGHDSILFGRITGVPKISKKILSIVYDPETDRKVELGYNLRRSVSWGPSLKRETLPFGLLNSMRANQTLFNIDNHWDAVYHSLYPAFKKDDKLFLSIKINSDKQIRNHSVVSLLSYLSELEVIAKEFEHNLTINNFDDIFNKYVEDDLLTTTTKAQFHSPGEIWTSISSISSLVGNLDNWVLYAVLLYAMLFGNQKLGFDGLVDIVTRRKLWDLAIYHINKRKINKVTESLALSAPIHDTKCLEDSSKDEKD